MYHVSFHWHQWSLSLIKSLLIDGTSFYCTTITLHTWVYHIRLTCIELILLIPLSISICYCSYWVVVTRVLHLIWLNFPMLLKMHTLLLFLLQSWTLKMLSSCKSYICYINIHLTLVYLQNVKTLYWFFVKLIQAIWLYITIFVSTSVDTQDHIQKDKSISDEAYLFFLTSLSIMWSMYTCI